MSSMKPFDFKDLFVLDLANNHQGSIEHGMKIIEACARVAKENQVRAAIKFQFRNLDTFIHPQHKTGSDHKYVTRFQSTRLRWDAFKALYDTIRDEGLESICTPFDEASVEIAVDMGFDVLKVASCSASDWPLLEKIAQANRPVIFSTGGLDLKSIDELASFFDHRGVDYAIMHCVSIYPIPDDKFQLNQIDILKKRYPKVPIGWSTHERPSDTLAIAMAVAKGATIYEKHVGLPTDSIKLNDYSVNPEQLDTWMKSFRLAKTMCGYDGPRIVPQEEIESLNSLMRGVYLKRPVEEGEVLDEDAIYFAIPYVPGQVHSGQIKPGTVAKKHLEQDSMLRLEDVSIPDAPDYQVLKSAIHEVKAILNEARVVLGSEFEVEYSHHYGIRNFKDTGAVIINCINREYAKKIIVQLPNQKHPAHYHRRKEETFQVLYGVLESELDGHRRTLHPGDTLLVQPGVWHRFWTETGVVFEEISTTHFNDDSYYKDKSINNLPRHARKTKVNHWGRYEVTDLPQASLQ